MSSPQCISGHPPHHHSHQVRQAHPHQERPPLHDWHPAVPLPFRGKERRWRGNYAIQVGQTYSSWLCVQRRVASDPATDVSKFETVGSLVRIACSNLSSCCTRCNNLCEAEGERGRQSWLPLHPPDHLVLQVSWHHRDWPKRLNYAGIATYSNIIRYLWRSNWLYVA